MLILNAGGLQIRPYKRTKIRSAHCAVSPQRVWTQIDIARRDTLACLFPHKLAGGGVSVGIADAGDIAA